MAAITLTTDLPGALGLLDRPSQPDPSQRLSARVLQTNLQSDPPGYGLENRYTQTDHNRGVIALATKAYMDSVGAAKFTLLERKTTVTKSLGGVGNYSRDDEYEPADPDHPLARVLEMPGGEEGVWSMGQECVYLTLQHMLTGDAPVWTPCNADGKPVQFYSLTSALVEPLFGWGTNPQYPRGAYRVTPYTGTGFFAGAALLGSAILPGEEVGRFREPHPWARNLGMSRLQSGAREIDVLDAITQSRWSAFQNKAQLDTLVMMPGADQASVEAFYERFNQRMTGPHNAGRVLVLGGGFADTGGKAGVSQLGPPVPEMGYANSYEQQAGTVLAMFRVPRGIAGFTSQTSYSQLYAEQQQFYDLGLQPYARHLSVFLTQTLARKWSRFPGQFKIEVEIAAPKNLEAEAAERQFAVSNNLTSVNEYRKATGRRPVEGGDVPKAVWDAKAQQSVQPPEQAPEGAPDAGGEDPLAALLGGGDQPGAGAVPQPDNPDAEGSLPPQAKALDAAFLKAGFTGVIKDSLGREIHYQDGRRVANPNKRPAARSSQSPDRGAAPKASINRPPKPGESSEQYAARVQKLDDFLKDAPRAGETPQQFAERHYPELAEIRFVRFMPDADGSRPESAGVVVEGVGTRQAREHVHDAWEMRDVLKALGRRHTRVFIGDKPVPQLDSNQDLAGQRPRGWPRGKTWDAVAGVYNGAVSAGVGDHGSVSLLAHEAGHAIGAKFKLDDDPELIEWHKQLHDSLDPYEQQGGPGAKTGREEMLAESVALYYRRGRDAVAGVYSPKYARWLEQKLAGVQS